MKVQLNQTPVGAALVGAVILAASTYLAAAAFDGTAPSIEVAGRHLAALDEELLVGDGPRVHALSREKVAPPQGPPGLVHELASVINAGDGVEAGRLALAWFDAHSGDPVRALIDLAGSGERSEEECRAVGTLMRLGVHMLEHDPERMSPWTTDSFADASIDLLGAHRQVPALLWTAFADAGPRLGAERLGTLLDTFRSRRVASGARDQAWCLQLGKRWASTMPAEVEAQLLARAAAAEGSESMAADAAAMLLARNWRLLTPDLAAITDVPRSAASQRALEHVIGSHAQDLEPLEQAAYFEAFAGRPAAALAVAWNMSASGAAMAREGREPGTFAETVLALRARADVPEELAVRLLADDRIAELHPSLAWFTAENMLSSDAAFTPGLSGRILEAFGTADSQRDRLFRTLAQTVPSLEQEPLLAAVLPILDASRHESRSRGRDRLVAALRARFPEMNLE